MGEELTKPVDGGDGAAPEGVGASETVSGEAASQETPTFQITPEIQELIEQEVGKVKQEYEDVHIAKLKSKKDKEIAQLKKQLNKRQQTDLQGVYDLMQTDPERATQMLLEQNQALLKQQAMESQQQDWTDWAAEIAEDLGLDLENEETAEWAAEWVEKLIENPDLSWDFQQEAAHRMRDAKDDAHKATQKELKDLKDALPTLIKEGITQFMAKAGYTPEPTGEGGVPKKQSDWRDKPTGQLRSDGLAQRRAAAVKQD